MAGLPGLCQKSIESDLRFFRITLPEPLCFSRAILAKSLLFVARKRQKNRCLASCIQEGSNDKLTSSPHRVSILPNFHMSSKKREREPDLNQFRIESVVDDDLPIETFFMALDSREAIKMLAYSCLKYLSVRNMSETAIDCFVNAYANPGKSFLEPPEMIPVPEPLTDLKVAAGNISKTEVSELEQESNQDSGEVFPQTNEARNEEISPPDPSGDSEGEGEKKPLDGTPGEKNIFTDPPKEEKPNPAIEHAREKKVREEEIIQAKTENERRRMEYESLSKMALLQVEELNERLSVLKVDEHNRWSDEWASITYPLADEDEGHSESPEE
jgi:hypothetical protein